ncbi:hypothetical protein V1477_019567 [Vespula maculifrons]|uniref:Uncharacterized protein n=1 Tax=Vespula maculifrons TaxID=7453 RepID=A0ABD2ARF9_VESMC
MDGMERCRIGNGGWIVTKEGFVYYVVNENKPLCIAEDKERFECRDQKYFAVCRKVTSFGVEVSRTISEIEITSLETVGIPQNTAGSPVSGLIKVFSGSTAGTTGTPGRQINRSGLPPYHLTL